MNKKIIGIALVIIGVIVLIGSIGFAAPLLLDLSTGLDELRQGADPSLLAFGQQNLQTLANELSKFVIYAWVWIIAATITALFCIYQGVQLLRKKK